MGYIVMSEIKKNYIFVGAVKKHNVSCFPKMYAKKNDKYRLTIHWLYFLPDYICILSGITFAERCALQFVTIALASGANTP